MSKWIAKTGIGKIRIRTIPLGNIINPLFNKILHSNIPDPIEAQGAIIYHRVSDGRGLFGWCYAFDYEVPTCDIIKQIVKSGMTVVDVGAHIGYYTLLLAKQVGNAGKVFAFEPDPSYYALLKKNIEVNNLSTIIEPFKVAVGDSQKKATLFLGRSTGSSIFKTPDATEQTVITEVISLDKFFSDRSWSPVDLIKMDIEGAEKIALKGMSQLVRKNQDLKLIIELNPSFLGIAGVSAQELLMLLGEFGFKRIRALLRESQIFLLPQDIQDLVSLARKLNYVNLFCEK